MDIKEKEEYLRKKGWGPVYDDIHMRDPEYIYPILVGWLKEPSMRVYSADLAYEKEQQAYELIIETSCGRSQWS